LNEFNKGFSEKEIKEKLLEAGWRKDIIDCYLNEVRNELRLKRGRIEEKLEQLKRYIENELKKGFSEKEIKEKLLEAGWKENIIKNFFRAIIFGFNRGD